MSNLYTTIMSIDEFERLDKQRQKELMEKWREIHPNDDIMDGLGVRKNRFYNLLDEIGIKKTNKGPRNGAYGTNDIKQDLEQWKVSSEIMPYATFRDMPVEQQIELFDFYRLRTNFKSLVNVWGVTRATIYGLSSKLNTEKRKLVKKGMYKEKDETKLIDQLGVIDIPDKKEPVQEVQNRPNLDDKTNPDINVQDDEKDVQDAQNEGMNDIHELIQQLQEEIIELKNQKTDQVANPTPRQDPQDGQNDTSMAMVYKKTTEGFDAYQDIRQFIQVLHKNPDEFDIEIKIKRK